RAARHPFTRTLTQRNNHDKEVRMQLPIHVLLIVAGAFLLGNSVVSFVAASWVQQITENWWLGPLANRWGIGRVRLFLILNGLVGGLIGVASVAAGTYSLLNG